MDNQRIERKVGRGWYGNLQYRLDNGLRPCPQATHPGFRKAAIQTLAGHHLLRIGAGFGSWILAIKWQPVEGENNPIILTADAHIRSTRIFRPL